MNRIFGVFCIVQLALIAAVFAMCRRKRTDVAIVIAIGPLISTALAGLHEDWRDPNWYIIVAVCSISWFVSIAVGCCYWHLKRKH